MIYNKSLFLNIQINVCFVSFYFFLSSSNRNLTIFVMYFLFCLRVCEELFDDDGRRRALYKHRWKYNLLDFFWLHELDFTERKCLACAIYFLSFSVYISLSLSHCLTLCLCLFMRFRHCFCLSLSWFLSFSRSPFQSLSFFDIIQFSLFHFIFWSFTLQFILCVSSFQSGIHSNVNMLSVFNSMHKLHMLIIRFSIIRAIFASNVLSNFTLLLKLLNDRDKTEKLNVANLNVFVLCVVINDIFSFIIFINSVHFVSLSVIIVILFYPATLFISVLWY